MKKFFYLQGNSYIFAYFFIGLISFSIYLLFDGPKFIDSFFYALKFKENNIDKDKEIVVIEINKDTFDRFGPLPWNRKIWGELVSKIVKFDPKVVGIDLIFDRELEKEGDAVFAEVIKKNGNIMVLASELKNYKLKNLYHDLMNSDPEIAYTNLTNTEYIGVATIDQAFEYKHFVFKIIEKYFSDNDTSGEKNDEKYSVESIPLPFINPINLRSNQFPIYYIGGKEFFTTVPLQKVLSGDIDLQLIKDKIVLIGITSDDYNDSFFTPLTFFTGIRTPGVIIWANAISTILNERFIYALPIFIQFCIVLFFSVIIGTLIEGRTYFKNKILVLLIGIIVYTIVAYTLFSFLNLYINLGPIILCVIIITIVRIDKGVTH